MPQVIDHSVLDSQLAGLSGAGHWYVAFSGGVDSTVLLHLVNNWARANPGSPPLTALHINHALQVAADDWEVHCAWICKFLQIPFKASRVSVEVAAKGPEAAARDARYGVFEEQLEEGDVLFLGHHLDDQIETFFLRLMRGAGLQGLAAIPGSRSLGRGRLVRPLLGLSRSQLEAYATQCGLECIEDPSNRDSSLDRNFLRNELLPLLATRWPAYRQTVNRASEHMASALDVLQQDAPAVETHFSLLGDPGIPAEELEQSPQAIAAIALRDWLRSGGYAAPDQQALNEFLRQLQESAEGANPRLQTSEYALQRYRDTVYLLPLALDAVPASLSISPGEVLDLPGIGQVSLAPATGEGLWLDPDDTLELRWRQGGERCRPVGRDCSTRLKKLFQEEGVPPWWRSRVPLLYLDEELQAVGGLWPCLSSRYGSSGRGDERCYSLTWTPTIRGGFD